MTEDVIPTHIDSALAEYLNRQGRQIQREGGWSRARRYFCAARDLDPTSFLSLYNLAIVDQLEGKLDAAKQKFLHIVHASPSAADRADSLVRLGNIYDEQGNPDEAYRCYASILDIVIDDTHDDERARIEGDALCGMGYIEEGRGNIDRAIELYEQAMRADPMGLGQVQNLAYAYTEKGDFEKAITTWKSALNLASSDNKSWQGMGVTYLEAGDIAQARMCFEQALALGHPKAQEALDSLSE